MIINNKLEILNNNEKFRWYVYSIEEELHNNRMIVEYQAYDNEYYSLLEIKNNDIEVLIKYITHIFVYNWKSYYEVNSRNWYYYNEYEDGCDECLKDNYEDEDWIIILDKELNNISNSNFY